MKLKKLLKDIPSVQVKGSKEIEITGISSNSKLLGPGNLFIAKKGRHDDGNRYIPEAIAADAAAILTDIYNPSLKKEIVQLIHPNIGAIEGELAAEFYHEPSNELFLVGITGTNGKTTSSFLIKHLLDRLEMPCGLIGTIEYIIGQHRYQATHTTPDVHTNHRMLREMVLQGCKSAVMEVTSHALDQGRVDCIEYDVALFTNLTLDHLDYHQTMEKYCEAKNRLFATLKSDLPSMGKKQPKWGIINADSPWGSKIGAGCKAKILTYGIQNHADVRGTNIALTPTGTAFDVTYQGQTVTCHSPLVGRFNVYNTLGAICVGLARGISLEQLIQLIPTFPAIPGRLEVVPNSLGLKIYVDFAHSPDSLTNVLECLQEFKKGRIITVFGCGGNRDQTKRPQMAQAVEELSDMAIVTSDNPRSEDPEVICQQMVKGFTPNARYLIEVDRRKAIAMAIEMATPTDIILIAGKGHETYQAFAHKTIEFDDRKVAVQLCSEAKRVTV
jgi:UDP-N-acetylmuramoyl-L-alanyl-D-glutamate--2,6-diaminopimelate ligase